jgi:hypothetical protein
MLMAPLTAELAQPVKKPRLANIQISLESKAATELIQSIETPKPSVDDSLKKVLSVS